MTDLNKTLNDNLEEIKEKSGKLKRQIGESTVGYIATAMGIVAGLAWNDAIKALIEYIFPLSQNTLFAKFFYAVLITALAVFVTKTLLSRFSGTESE